MRELETERSRASRAQQELDALKSSTGSQIERLERELKQVRGEITSAEAEKK